jgi:dTDP-4-dehydrorhamnose reductase
MGRAMRIEVVGSQGQLGRELLKTLAGSPHHASGHDIDRVDIRDPASIAALFAEVRPDVVINCAAWTRVDAAEDSEDEARRVNTDGPRLLAEACRDRGVLLCHLSTDYVFDGWGSSPIDERSPAHPRSAYGRTKLAGEEAIRRTWRRHQIVRTAWLYGQDGPNFVLTMLRLAGEGRPLRVVADQCGSPTWTGHLAPAIMRLVEREMVGTFHLTNSGSCTWYDLALAIMQEAGREVTIEAVTGAEYPTPAPRPRYSVLDNKRWRELGETPLPDWREGLRAYLSSLPSSLLGG